jgi:SHS2 domain-containing protein
MARITSHRGVIHEARAALHPHACDTAGMATGGYEVIEHTADAGIVAIGETKAEAFAQAAEGMYSLLTNPMLVHELEEREVSVEARDDTRLLERWLLELLFLTETEGLLFGRFDVSIEGSRLRATAHGERIDPERHELRGDIKGVTRHMTQVECIDGGCRVSVLLDM